MKRSEMLQLIFKTLCEPVPYHDDGSIQLMWKTENLLNAIEEAGMSPPCSWIEAESPTEYGACPKWDKTKIVPDDPLAGLVGWQKRSFEWEQE